MKKNSKSELVSMLKELDLTKGFPHEDINLIQDRYKDRIPGLQVENRLVEDFNNFQLLVAGSVSYVLAGKKIPDYQKQFLNKSFFDSYPIYHFLECVLEEYPNFKEDLVVFEKAREILCDF